MPSKGRFSQEAALNSLTFTQSCTLLRCPQCVHNMFKPRQLFAFQLNKTIIVQHATNNALMHSTFPTSLTYGICCPQIFLFTLTFSFRLVLLYQYRFFPRNYSGLLHTRFFFPSYFVTASFPFLPLIIQALTTNFPVTVTLPYFPSRMQSRFFLFGYYSGIVTSLPLPRCRFFLSLFYPAAEG